MNLRLLNAVAALVLALLLMLNARSVIHAHEQGVRLRFGEVIQIGLPPGAYLRWPVGERIEPVDMRIRFSDLESEPLADARGDTMRVDAWAVWRIRDLRRYYGATGADPARAAELLRPILREGLRGVAARGQWPQLRTGLPAGEREALIANANRRLKDELGMELLGIGIRRVRFTPEVEAVVIERMRLQKDAEVEALRAEALAQAAAVREAAASEDRAVAAEADARVAALTADARREAAALVAAEAARDPALARYFSALEAWRGGFGKPGDVLVLAKGSELAALRAKLKLDQKPAPAPAVPAPAPNTAPSQSRAPTAR